MSEKQEKTRKLYLSIGDVATLLGVNESTLRFWEKEFEEISPRKTKKGTRYYREEDVEQVRLIYHLLKERGMTLAGARRKLKENKETTVQLWEIRKKLNRIRTSLISMIDAINELEKNEKEKINE